MPAARRQPDRLAILLFWLMAAAGGLALAPCLILPAWFEHQAQRAVNAAAAERIALLQDRLQVVEKQIEYIQHDPAYVERIARQELGLRTPGVTSVLVDPVDPSGPLLDAPSVATPPPDPLPELSVFLERVLLRYPAMSIFVEPVMRTALMIFGAAMLTTATVLLGGASRRQRRAMAE